MAKTMIEPYVTERQCTTCKQCKPVTEYGRSARYSDGLRRQCLDCCRTSSRISQARRRAQGRRQPDKSPGAWKLPTDTRPEEDKALDYVLRSFRECEPAANLTWILGAVA